MLATVEPWHGAGVAIYAERPTGPWAKTTVESALTEGHALGWADFDGDKQPDIVASGRATRNIKIYWNETKKGTGH